MLEETLDQQIIFSLLTFLGWIGHGECLKPTVDTVLVPQRVSSLDKDGFVVREPLVLQNILETEPLLTIFLEQPLDKVASGSGNLVPRLKGEVRRILDGLPSDLFVILVVEREDAAQEQVNDDAEGPEVDLLPVRLLQEDLWCDV